jgi:hypothetical protein
MPSTSYNLLDFTILASSEDMNKSLSSSICRPAPAVDHLKFYCTIETCSGVLVHPVACRAVSRQ